jgi:hypothetical protein
MGRGGRAGLTELVQADTPARRAMDIGRWAFEKCDFDHSSR